ncbi:tRNA lysidine(34) synthetase TilS, partial [Solidesulfovibrio sp.]|uniref:tRNA lysidine(34) synthetase TilS n=1 Tax=Solidesulfovibrio sp. TaxID=2910990 RepID=UPI00261A5DE5
MTAIPPSPPDAGPGPDLGALPRPQALLCLSVARFLTRDCGHDPAGATWIVGLSGGPDSLVLFTVLSVLAPRLGARLEAAHLDHGLRPESAAEAASVAAFCRERAVVCHVRRADVAGLARSQGRGIEDAGRAARYAFFAELAGDRTKAWIVLGHQLNDLAEDQLLRATRGAGWPALGGMPALDAARRLLRPLLLTPRAAIEAFAAALALPTLADPSNADRAFRRNRLRHDVLPLLCAENPRYLDAAARLWRQARLDAALFESLLPAADDPAVLPLATVLGLHPTLRPRLYRKALASLGPGQALADALRGLDDAVTRRQTGRVFQFPGGKQARITR